MNHNFRYTEGLDTSISDMQKIAEEVWTLLGATDVFDMLNGQGLNTKKLDERLQEVLRGAHAIKADALSCWLRYTYKWSDDLPTWQPLLNVTYSIMLSRYPRNIVEEDLLVGLLPRTNS